MPRLKARAHGNARGRLDLVAREHPYLDTRAPEGLDSQRHLVLQLVYKFDAPKVTLNASDTQQVHVPLERLYTSFHCFLPVVHLGSGSFVPLRPRLILFGVDEPLRDHESSEALTNGVYWQDLTWPGSRKIRRS